jgi:hypothetical protein
MEPQNPLIVRTAAQPISSLGDQMANMRIWLDRNRIDLADFRLVTVSVGNIAFDVQFTYWQHVALFRAAFVSVASATSPEQPVARQSLVRRYRRAA